MEDKNAGIPHDQETMDAISSAEQFLMFDENNEDPLLDDFINGDHDFSGICFDEDKVNESTNCNDFPQNSGFGNPIRIPVWPIPPSPHGCTCCQTLREFFHTNGSHVLKLEIHGRLGLISHAVLERSNNDMSTEDHEFHMFDFCQESISNVKQFLVRYCEDRKQEGFIMLQDPLSDFYNALCIGIDDDGGGALETDLFLQQTPTGDTNKNQENNLNQQTEEGNGASLTTKSYIAAQRERTGKMRLRDLAGYFHLPINAASKAVNICPSAIKSICRKEGLLRWPYRKIKSIESKILKKKESLNSNDANERERAVAEIRELERELSSFYEAYVG